MKICQAISLKADVDRTIQAAIDTTLGEKALSSRLFRQRSILKKVRNQTSVALYRSSIALQIGAESTQIREKIATQIAQFFRSSAFDSSAPDNETIHLSDLTVSINNIGLLEFEFGEDAIAQWLQLVLNACSSEPNPNSAFPPSLMLSGNSLIFFCQYTHARCSTLLRLIEMPKDITGIYLEDQKLLLRQERSLIEQIITTLDEWEDSTPLEAAVALSQTFQEFYQFCQIVKYDTVNPQIAQRRLALVMITHWLLKQLLEQGLGVLAPETL